MAHIHFGKSLGFVAGGIGDQIFHLTQLRSLAHASHGNQIDIACISPKPISKLLVNSPWAGDIIDARPLRRYIPAFRGTEMVSTIRQSKYESAFILHRSSSFKLASLAAHIPRRVGLSGHWLDQFLLTKTLSTTAGGERRSLWGHLPFVASIDEWITSQNLILDEKTPTILPNPRMLASVAKFLAKLPRPIFVVNLFAADAMRRWSLDHANSTLQLLALETGGSLILNSGPDAVSYHSAMFEKWSGSADQLINNLPNPPSMERDVALYHLVDGYVGVNSFTANLALNCNLPAIVLYNKASDILRYRSTVFPAVSRAAQDLSAISAKEIVELCANMLREKR